MNGQFRVEVRKEGREALIAVTGELDLASAPELEQVLERFSDEPTELLVIDLRGVDFMDSTGLSIIVKAHQRFAESGRGQPRQGLLSGAAPPRPDRGGQRLPVVDSPEELFGED